MNTKQKNQDVVTQVVEIISKTKTANELQEVLHAISYSVGGMICHFDKEDRSQILINLTQTMGMGLQSTAKSIGEPSDIEIVVGSKPY